MTSWKLEEARRRYCGSIYETNYFISNCRGVCITPRRVSDKGDQVNVMNGMINLREV